MRLSKPRANETALYNENKTEFFISTFSLRCSLCNNEMVFIIIYTEM